MRQAPAHRCALVPVAAILVASIRLHALDVLLHLRWRGPNEMPCDAPVHKGQELGWFEHGSHHHRVRAAGLHALMPEGIATGARRAHGAGCCN